MIGTVKRVLVDQLLFSPVFLAVFFAYNHIGERGKLAGLSNRFKAGYAETLKANYKLWPLVQCINFYLVPLNYQLLFLNFVAIGWTAFLSNANAKASQSPDYSSIKKEEDCEKALKFKL
jgi:protein Mpv17